MSKDLLGQAILDYHTKKHAEPLTVKSPTMETHEMPVPYLFRTYAEMTKIEQVALNKCSGHILDVGAAAGCHSLWLAENKHQVTALEQSPKASQVLKARLANHAKVKVIQGDLWSHDATYDTLLMLMNGTGFLQKKAAMLPLLLQLKKKISPQGQILIDGADIKYLYEEEEDGGLWLPAGIDYHGEVSYQFCYQQQYSDPFDWLYADATLLEEEAHKAGLDFKLLYSGDQDDYLAQLTLKKEH